MNNTKTPSGFAALEAILILVILAIIGFTGYYVWHSQNDANKTLEAANKSGQSAATTPVTKAKAKTKATAASNPPQSSQKYLTITQWGIRIPYGTSYNFTYTLKGEYAQTSTDQLVAADANCSTDDAAAGIIQRAVSTDQVDEDGKTAAQAAAAGQHNAHIGKYYYFYSSPQASCSDNTSTNNLQTAAIQELKALVPLAEAN